MSKYGPMDTDSESELCEHFYKIDEHFESLSAKVEHFCLF